MDRDGGRWSFNGSRGVWMIGVSGPNRELDETVCIVGVLVISKS